VVEQKPQGIGARALRKGELTCKRPIMAEGQRAHNRESAREKETFTRGTGGEGLKGAKEPGL